MRLINIAKESITLLQQAGEKGINNIELAKKINIPRRRIYDIIAILKASNAIETKREKKGTRIFWKGNKYVDINNNSKKEFNKNLDNKNIEELVKIKQLEKENNELKQKIEVLSNLLNKYSGKITNKTMNFPNKSIIIRSNSPSEKIKRVQSSKYQVFIEVDQPGLIVEPVG